MAREIVLDEAGDLRAEDPAQDEDRQAHPVLSQPEPFLDVGDAHVRRADRLQLAGHLDQPVAVGVGLEDGHDARRRHVRGDHPVVLGQPLEVDLEVGRPQLVGGDGRLVKSHGISIISPPAATVTQTSSTLRYTALGM